MAGMMPGIRGPIPGMMPGMLPPGMPIRTPIMGAPSIMPLNLAMRMPRPGM